MRKGQPLFAPGTFDGATLGSAYAETLNQNNGTGEAKRVSKKPSLPVVLIVCAKYHELDQAEICAREVAKNFEDVKKPVQHYRAKTKDYEVIFVSPDKPGPVPTASFVPSAIAAFEPNYVTMIGCCATLAENKRRLNTVLLCERAFMFDHENPPNRDVYSCDVTFAIQERWEKSLRLPTQKGFIITCSSIEENPEETLGKHACHGLEMESAAVWLAVDDFCRLTGKAVGKLPIFKGWSDCGGGKAERDANKRSATLNAAHVAVSYLNHLFGQ
jgi:nucleoside phosphorylase